MQSTGHASTQAWSFVPMQGSAITYAICWLPLQRHHRRRVAAATTPNHREAKKTGSPVNRWSETYSEESSGKGKLPGHSTYCWWSLTGAAFDFLIFRFSISTKRENAIEK